LQDNRVIKREKFLTVKEESNKLRHALTILVVSITAFGCIYDAPQYTVPPSFSIHVSNDHNAVVGLKLRVTRFKASEFSRLSREEQRVANLGQLVEIIAESITDNSGDAYFNLATTGHFDIRPSRQSARLDCDQCSKRCEARRGEAHLAHIVHFGEHAAAGSNRRWTPLVA
jgi:hypothetical protein